MVILQLEQLVHLSVAIILKWVTNLVMTGQALDVSQIVLARFLVTHAPIICACQFAVTVSCLATKNVILVPLRDVLLTVLLQFQSTLVKEETSKILQSVKMIWFSSNKAWLKPLRHLQQQELQL